MKARAAGMLLASLAAWHLGSGGYIHLKALAAQQLLEHAWHRTIANERTVRPWPWADTQPVARLRASVQGRDLIVLAGASGRSLAFGPAHVSGTALPGDPGSSVIAGHRDTHFRFLRELRPGDPLEIQRRDGASVHYRVTRMRIVDSRLARLVLDEEVSSLRLVTCYPFDAVRAGGPLRFEVTAQAVTGAVRGGTVAHRQRNPRERTERSAVATGTGKVTT